MIYFKKQSQIKVLLFDKTPTIVLVKYFNYSNIFLAKNLVEFQEYTGINNYTIKLEKNKQLFFRPIYSLKLVKLETLKTYIKTKFANYFIWPFKFFIKVSILFNQKLNRSFCFCGLLKF